MLLEGSIHGPAAMFRWAQIDHVHQRIMIIDRPDAADMGMSLKVVTQVRTSSPFSIGSKLDEYDDNNDVTYVAAGTAPVPTFHVNSCGAASSHSTAAPITTFAAPVMSAGAASHPVSTYPPVLNLPIDQCDLRHFDQGVPLLGSNTDELSSSAQLMFSRKGP
ncbi:unnamed protein product, partial [Strongylus vulgaris]